MRRHYFLTENQKFKNDRQEEMRIVSYSKYQTKNHYYLCENCNTKEQKEFQYSAIRNGNWTFLDSRMSSFLQNSQFKDDPNFQKLHKILSKKYIQLIWRIEMRESYSSVKNRFISYRDFFYEIVNQTAFDDIFVSHDGRLAQLLNGEIEIDKDLISSILIKAGLISEKEYSLITILATTKNENRGKIREAINSNRIKNMLECLQSISKYKYDLIIALLNDKFNIKKGA